MLQFLADIQIIDKAFSALTLLIGRQEGLPECKNRVVGCWHGFLFGASIIDFPNLGSTYNGGWCTATETDETLITRPSREVNVK